MPQLVICSCSTRRFTSLSSTISTRKPRKSATGVGSACGCVSSCRGSVNQKVEPAQLAGHADLAAHQLHQLFGDRQPQPGSAELPRGRPVHLAELLKQAAELVFRNSRPVSSTATRTVRLLPVLRSAARR
jgi:hypothetical protein